MAKSARASVAQWGKADISDWVIKSSIQVADMHQTLAGLISMNQSLPALTDYWNHVIPPQQHAWAEHAFASGNLSCTECLKGIDGTEGPVAQNAHSFRT